MYVRIYIKFLFILIICCIIFLIFVNSIYNVNNAVYLNSSLIIPQLRTNNLYNIKIVTIVNSLNTNKYEVAIRTTKCYAAHFKYEYYLIVIKDGDTLSGKCCQEDFMYKRHCFLSYYMKENFKDGDFVLVLDADIGIINPSYLLETFIPKAGEEIIFYERIFNHEIMAGSFFLKNSKYTRNFLLNWSYYDFKHPNSFDGSDNVGLHYFLLDYIPIEFKMRKGKCYKLWEKAKNWKDCSVFVACIRYIINKACYNHNSTLIEYKNYYSLDNGRIKILKKNSPKRWTRDIWLTSSKWSLDDFMLHGLKTDTIGYFGFGSWHLPIKMTNFNFTLCYSNNYSNNWVYYKRYFSTTAHVKSLLKMVIDQTKELYQKELKESGILNY